MQDRFAMHGKVALVTGAGGGLGAHFAQTLAEAGATTVLAGRRRPPLDALAARLAGLGAKAHAVVMDVRDPASVAQAYTQIEDECGPVDVAVCNAGITAGGKSLDLAPQEWQRVLDTNLTGCWLVARETARRLVAAQRPGAIVTISSILGHRVAGGVLPYTVSKAALEQMTRALALEWARHGIRVNALAPGYVRTDLNAGFFDTAAGQAMIQRIPQRRLGRREDLDGALLLLCSDASAYMTGATIVVDGGHLQSTL